MFEELHASSLPRSTRAALKHRPPGPSCSGSWNAWTGRSSDLIADNPGPTLFHCHQALHMDFGFMAMFEYA